VISVEEEKSRAAKQEPRVFEQYMRERQRLKALVQQVGEVR
jgi:hypothetical protein